MNIPVQKNKEYIVKIVDNGFEGEGIAKIEGYTIFIPNAIKGESKSTNIKSSNITCIRKSNRNNTKISI